MVNKIVCYNCEYCLSIFDTEDQAKQCEEVCKLEEEQR
jgi:hypothetical protein